MAIILTVDDFRLGRAIRALRRRRGWRQADVGRRAGLSQDLVSLVESGRLERVALRSVRRLARALDAELVIGIRWRAGELDRLLDEGHAELVGAVAGWLQSLGWETHVEVTFAVFGERGSIDLLAWHAPTRTLLVVEVKTTLLSVEETLRRDDVKVRLAPGIARSQLGWDAVAVGRLLVLPDTTTARRRVDRHEAVLGRVYPLRGRHIRAWVRAPRGNAAGLLFAARPARRGPNAAPASRRVRLVQRPVAR